MAENTIVLAKSFTPLLDEVYKKESVTSDLTGDIHRLQLQDVETMTATADTHMELLISNGYQQNTTMTEVLSCLLM